MMMITRQALPRRTFLRGMGATVALPLLDAMVPSLTALAQTAARSVRRLGFVYVPMGSDISRWTPPGDSGALGALSSSLSPLESVKERLTVLTNLELRNAYPGTHATSHAGFLSAATPIWTESADCRLGTTVDQIAAQHIGEETPLPSLELAVDIPDMVGQCDNGYACVYQNSLSWSSPTTPLQPEAHPRVVFERLFGDGGTANGRRTARDRSASLLDRVREDITRLRGTLGRGDRSRVDQYLESVREVEGRIQRADAQTSGTVLPDLDRPVGVPASYAEHVRLMFDLQALALQGDMTRVISFQLARESSNRTYDEIGVPDPHHATSHHRGDPEKIAQLAKINQFHVSLFAEFLGRLKATPDGDGSLLDNTLYLYGSGMGDPDLHDHVNLPVLVAGGGGSTARGGRQYQVRPAHPDVEPAPDAARGRGRQARFVLRQHGHHRDPGRAGPPDLSGSTS